MALSGSASAAGLSGSTSRTRLNNVTAKEPSYVDVFYNPTNRQYAGHWHDGTRGTQVGDVPKISEILALKPTIKKPVRPLQTTARTILADTIREERTSGMGDKVISADVVPKKFPVQSHQYEYPAAAKKGANNPLYQTSAQAYGKEAPEAHQVPDTYFPSTGHFTKNFVEKKPRYTGLTTGPSLSKIHSALDAYY